MWLNRPHEVTALIVDGANCYEASKKAGYMIDYAKVLKFFKPQQAMYLTALPESDKENNPNPLFKMIDYINYNEYTVIKKPTKTFYNEGVPFIKGNMDVEITLALIKSAHWANHIVLFSGDGDFRSAVEEVQNHGVRVTVVSALDMPLYRGQKQAPMVADELRRQANIFIDLCDAKVRGQLEWVKDNRKGNFLHGAGS